jgi:hypothetical protein
MSDTMAVQIALVLTTGLGLLFQWLKAGRDRKWQEEDRKRTAEADAARLVTKTQLEQLIAEAQAIKERGEERHEAMTSTINDAKQAASQAYKEANDLNKKIKDLNDRMLQLGLQGKSDIEGV